MRTSFHCSMNFPKCERKTYLLDRQVCVMAYMWQGLFSQISSSCRPSPKRPVQNVLVQNVRLPCPLKYSHFFLCSLLQVHLVRSLFRHRHDNQGLSYPLADSSFKLTMPNCDLSLDLLCHSLHRTTFAGKWDGFTLVRKSFLDFRRLLAVM